MGVREVKFGLTVAAAQDAAAAQAYTPPAAYMPPATATADAYAPPVATAQAYAPPATSATSASAQAYPPAATTAPPAATSTPSTSSPPVDPHAKWVTLEFAKRRGRYLSVGHDFVSPPEQQVGVCQPKINI